jgi:hypothetical protein
MAITFKELNVPQYLAIVLMIHPKPPVQNARTTTSWMTKVNVLESAHQIVLLVQTPTPAPDVRQDIT